MWGAISSPYFLYRGEKIMIVQEAIERANEMRAGNSASEELKIKWLSEIDHIIYNDVVKTHQITDEHLDKYREGSYEGYKDGSEMLIVSAPYDVLYVYWLMAQIDLKVTELNKYNNSLALFQEALKDYKAWYNRTHMPVAKKQIRLAIDGGV